MRNQLWLRAFQHKRHNEEGCQSGHGWHHLDNQEEDQTLFTSQEVVTAVGITSKYDDTCLNRHGNKAMIKVLRYQVPYRVSVKSPLKVIKIEVDVSIKFKGCDVTCFKG